MKLTQTECSKAASLFGSYPNPLIRVIVMTSPMKSCVHDPLTPSSNAISSIFPKDSEADASE